jgi:arsenite methyltransferase
MISRQYSVLILITFRLIAQTAATAAPGGEFAIHNDPRRDPWQKPEQVIQALNFSSTETVAVIESGFPYFAPRVSPLVSRVYAVNADARAFKGRGALPPSITRVTSIGSDPEIGRFDLSTVIMVDVLRWLPERSQYYQNLFAEMPAGARLVIIDRKFPPVFPVATTITASTLQTELSRLGFKLQKEYTFLPYQYFLVFQR